MSEWISVRDGIQETPPGQEVLVLYDGGKVDRAYSYSAKWWLSCCQRSIRNVTHWMTLPSSPEKGEQE